MNSSALWDFLNHDFPSVAQPAVSVFYLMLWLSDKHNQSIDADLPGDGGVGGWDENVRRPAPLGWLILLFDFWLSRGEEGEGWEGAAFCHFVMQHPVCVFNVN